MHCYTAALQIAVFQNNIVVMCSAAVISVKTQALLFTAMERLTDNCFLRLQICSVAKGWLSMAEATQTSLLYSGSVTIAKTRTYLIFRCHDGICVLHIKISQNNGKQS